MDHIRFLLRKGFFAIAVMLIGASGWMPFSRAWADASLPLVTAVSPASGPNDIDTAVEITGTGFTNDPSAPQVFLGETDLGPAGWVSETSLTAVIPWGLAAGVYSLRVVNADGGEALLDGAFEVTQGVGQWNSTAMDGGPIDVVLPIASTPGLIYAWSNSTLGVYRSSDYGAHWVTAGHSGGQFFKSGTGSPDLLFLNESASTDGGANWASLLPGGEWPGAGRNPGWYTQVFPDPADPEVLFLGAAEIPAGSGGPSGLLRSTDSGKTWTAAETGLLPGDTDVTAMTFSAAAIYLGTRDGNLYKSTDGGGLWVRVGSASVLPSIGVLEINPYQTNELWITTHFEVTASAKMAKMDLANPANITPVSAWPQDYYPKILGFVSASTVFVGGRWDHGWISRNSGVSWDIFEPSTGKPGLWLALDPWDVSKKTFYIPDAQYGVQKTADDGASWFVSNLGLHAMAPANLEVEADNPARVYARMAELGWPGIFISADGGQNWDFSSLLPASSGVRPMTSMLAVSAGRVFAGVHGNDVFGYGPQLYISGDGGSTWLRKDIDPTPVLSDWFHMPAVLKADPNNPNILLMTAVIGSRAVTTDQYVSEIYRSTDLGDTWQRVNLTVQLGREVHNLRSLGFDPHDPNIVYAAGDHDILKSTDNGLTWTVSASSDLDYLAGPIAVEPVPPYRVYVGSLVTLDGGLNWGPSNLPYGNANALTFLAGSDSLYIAGPGGMAFSLDGGSTWQSPAGPLAYAQINALAVGRSGQRVVIYVGTPGGSTPSGSSPLAIRGAAGASLEAGVYRMTEVHKPVYLPVVTRP
jgi:photosystem II stability/assembly factor-like uncharacterized protein